MSQASMPTIRGKGWTGSTPIEFANPLPADAAHGELLRFIAERHDGHLLLVGAVWDYVIRDETSFDGEAWHEFSNRFLDALNREVAGEDPFCGEVVCQLVLKPFLSSVEEENTWSIF